MATVLTDQQLRDLQDFTVKNAPFGRSVSHFEANLFPLRLQRALQKRAEIEAAGGDPNSVPIPQPPQEVIDAVRGAFRPNLQNFDFSAINTGVQPPGGGGGGGGTTPGGGGGGGGGGFPHVLPGDLPQGVFDNARFGNLRQEIIDAVRGAFRGGVGGNLARDVQRFQEHRRNQEILQGNLDQNRRFGGSFIDPLGPGLQPAIRAGNRSGALGGVTDFLQNRFQQNRNQLLALNNPATGPGGFNPTDTPRGIGPATRFGNLQPNILAAVRGAFRPQLSRSKGLASAGLPQPDSLNTSPGFPTPDFQVAGPTFQAATTSLPTLGEVDTPGTGIFGSPAPIGGGPVVGAPIQGGSTIPLNGPIGGSGGIFGGGIIGAPIQGGGGIFG